MADRIGTEIAGFRIESLIGRGGMGEVYLASQSFPERKVALKLLPHDLALDPSFRERFVRESNAAASLEHPNIVPVHGAGEAEGDLYLVMRFVEGEDLRTLLAREGPLTPERSIAICAQVADALQEAHEHGLIHRDVKPGNILIAKGDRAYLSDFGLIRRTAIETDLTKTGQLMGTVDYVPPEAIRGEGVDGRADVYSLGCVLFECLTGRPPFVRESEVATMYGHLEEPPPVPSQQAAAVPPGLDEAVRTAMAKRPEDRYASAHDLMSAMRAALPGALPERRRRNWIAALVGVVAVAVAALGVVLLLSGSDDPEGSPPSPARETAPTFDAGLLVVDPETGEVVDRHPGSYGGLAFGSGQVGNSLASGNGALWTTDSAIQGVRVDPGTGEATPISGADCTIDAVVVGLGSTWFVCPGSTIGTVLQVDPFDLSLRAIDTPGGQGATSGVASVRGTMWISASGPLIRFDELTRRSAVVEGVTSDDVAADARGVWITDELASTISRLDPSSGRIVDTFEVSGSIGDIAAGLGSVWVLDGGAGTVTMIDPQTGQASDPIGVGPGASTIRLELGAAWVCIPEAQQIARIDPLTGVVETFDVGAPAQVAVADPGGGTLWLLV
jgi:streptogramin lyase